VKLDANRRLTMVHEIGHWLGLMHPCGTADSSAGECRNSNGISDLLLMFEAVYNYQNNIKTCSYQVFPYVDPIHNYMGYSDDCCLYEFTSGQIAAMCDTFNEFRLRK
jgi:Pregnancy-associated plasma protein-A